MISYQLFISVVQLAIFSLVILQGNAFVPPTPPSLLLARRSSAQLKNPNSFKATPTPVVQSLMMSETSDTNEGGNSDELVLGAAGVFANVICGYSLYILKTTSCGLPPGPFGLLGAAEGISYLVVVGLFLYSAITKIKTGSGLPAGKYGLLGLAEGLTFLTVLGGIVIAGLSYTEYGFLPGFLPNDKCFGIND
jgi:hypothetical protein